MLTELPDFYESNLKLLKKYHPHIWSSIVEKDCVPKGELFLGPNGQPNLRVISAEGVEVTLHNQDRPDREVSEALNLVPEDSTGVVILIGMGLGYMLTALLEQRPLIRHMAVFDLGPGIFNQALKVMDFSKTLSDKRLILSFDHNPNIIQILAPTDKALQLEMIHRLRHLQSFLQDETSYEELDDKVFGFINSRNIAGSTDQKFGERFIKNRLTVIKSIHHNHLLETLKGCFHGIPAILVAGGPSLDKNIHLLPALKNKAVIIAVDSVLPSLLNHELTPHFITAIDPQQLNYEKIADYAAQANGVSLIAAPYVTPEIHQFFPTSNIFWTFSSKPIEEWINTMMDGKILTFGSSTSAHLNLTAAIIMGCSPIVFVGQDLAYSGYKDHAAGVTLSNPESAEKDFLDKNPDTVWIDGIDNKKIPSNRSFLSMKNHFETIVSANPGIHYINATEGGAHIAGTEVLLLEKVLDQYCTEKVDITYLVNTALQKAQRLNPRKTINKLTTTLQTTNKLSKSVSKYDELIQTIRNSFKKSKTLSSCRRPGDLPLNIQKKIGQAEILESKMDCNDNMKIWKILEEGTMTDVKESERALHKVKSNPEKDSGKFISNFIQNLDRLVNLNSARKKILSLFQRELTHIIDFQLKEISIQDNIQKKLKTKDNLLKLAKHYFENKKYVLVQPILNHLENISPNHGELDFYKGAIAAVQSRFDQSEAYFQKARMNDPLTINRIDAFRNKMGDLYFEISTKCKTDTHTNLSRKMLFKGIRHCGKNPKLAQEIDRLADNDSDTIKSAIETNTFNKVEDLLLTWLKELEENRHLISYINDKTIAIFYHMFAILFFTKNNMDEAFNNLEIALKLSPENPDFFATAADFFFSNNDFDSGILYLNKAVALDKSHATIWEKLGDRLQAEGKCQDAILAYEQGTILLPDNVNLLKKIGDCYRENGQLKPALEVYKLIKNLQNNPK